MAQTTTRISNSLACKTSTAYLVFVLFSHPCSDPQHRKSTLALGGLYTCPELVNAALAHSNDDNKKYVLDLGASLQRANSPVLILVRIGCGSGAWYVVLLHNNPIQLTSRILGLSKWLSSIHTSSSSALISSSLLSTKPEFHQTASSQSMISISASSNTIICSTSFICAISQQGQVQ